MKILINRSDAIGDTLLSLPVVSALKEKYPQAQIGILTSQRSREIFDMVRGIDEIWILPREKKKILKVAHEAFQKWRPDVYVYLGGSHVPTFCAWMNGIPRRLGLQSRLPSFLFLNEGVRQKRSEALHHESGYNLEVLSPLNKSFASEESKVKARDVWAPKLFWDPGIDERCNRYLSQLIRDEEKSVSLMTRERVVVHPGMTGHTLNWRMKTYVDWISRMEKESPGRFLFLISHTPSDREYIEAFQKEAKVQNLKASVVYFNGMDVGLKGFASVVSKASLFIGPSTGTTHIANLVGTPTIGLYSPIPTQSAGRWGPLRTNSQTEILSPKVECPADKECLGSTCQEYYCLDQVSSELAFERAQCLIEASREGQKAYEKR